MPINQNTLCFIYKNNFNSKMNIELKEYGIRSQVNTDISNLN